MNQIKKEEKEIIKEEDDYLKFDSKKAKNLVKILLTEDKLFKEYLNSILLFNDEQLENLFKGNADYKGYPYNIINNKKVFQILLWKFEEHNNILFEWYKDESKYDNLKNLWNQNYCICKLKDLSDEKLKEKLAEARISDIDNFIVDYRNILNNSIESKTSDITNHTKDKYFDFSSLDYSQDKKDEDSYNINDLEELKKEIGDIDLNKYEESMKKIISIGQKLYQLQIKIQKLIEDLDKEESKSREKMRLKNFIQHSGGVLAGVYAACYNFANLFKKEKELKSNKDLK